MKRKTNTKTVMTLGLSVLLCTTVLSACSGSGNNKETTPSASAPPSSASPTEQASDQLEGSLITKDPLELTIHMHYGNRFAFDDNWGIFKEAAKLTNISLKGVAPKTGTDSYEMMNLMLASGELPDIIHGFHAGFHEQGPDGVLIDLKDLINEHAPNIKALMDADPGIEKFATAPDGNMYFVPTIAAAGNNVAKGWLIRQDWLDKLGLPVPVTYQDYYNVLKAFKEQDPNGNGKADEVPFMNRNETSGIYDLLVFWDTAIEWKLADGKVVYGPSEDNFKEAVKNISQWYKEGLIDKEIFTRGPQAREVLFGDNVAGSTHDFMQSTTKFNETLAEQVPGFNMVPIPPPQNIHGQHVEDTANAKYANHGWGIGSSNKHPVETIKYFDFWYGEEGKILGNYGVKDDTYTVDANGEIQLTDKVKDGNILENMYLVGAQLEFPRLGDSAFGRFVNTPLVEEGFKMYTEGNYMKEQFPVLNYTEEEQKRKEELNGALNTYVNEMFQKWVLGRDSVEIGFDAFLKQMKSMGMDELVQIQQAAYDRYIQ